MMQVENANWKNFEIAADTTATRWRIIDAKRKTISNTDPQKITRDWKIISNKLICPADSALFVNALRVDILGWPLFKKWKRRNAQLILAIASIALLLMFLNGFGITINNKNNLGFVAALTLMLLVVLSINSTCKTPDHLAEQSEYFSALAMATTKYCWFPVAIVLISFGASQFGFGSLDDAAYAYGAVISTTGLDGLWRLFTGSFIHANLTHWVLNSFSLVILFPLIAFDSLGTAVPVFFLGTFGSQAVYFGLAKIGFPHSDLLVGFSGGIYALLAYLLVDTLVKKYKYPIRFSRIIISFALLGLVAGKLVNVHISMVAHLSGMCIGAFIYGIRHRYMNVSDR